MNIFRLAGDLCHLLAILMLLGNVWKTRSCAGISGKSQILFTLVYCTRYLDLFTTFISLYNSIMKIIYISSSCATVCLMYAKFKATYDRNHDTFRIEFLLIPVTIMALIQSYEFTLLEILWTFSIYLEAVAILPQLFLVIKTGEMETITSHYLLCLGSYRALYILNWIYRYYMEGYFDLITFVAGLVQTIFYCDFYLYISKGTSILFYTLIRKRNIFHSLANLSTNHEGLYKQSKLVPSVSTASLNTEKPAKPGNLNASSAAIPRIERMTESETAHPPSTGDVLNPIKPDIGSIAESVHPQEEENDIKQSNWTVTSVAAEPPKDSSHHVSEPKGPEAFQKGLTDESEIPKFLQHGTLV